MTHYGGCAVLFNKDTFFPGLPDKVREGESGWVVQGLLSRASFRRQPHRGQKSLTVMSLHINNSYEKKRSIGKKLILTIREVRLDEKVDMVAGDFNVAAWRRDNSASKVRWPRHLSTFFLSLSCWCHRRVQSRMVTKRRESSNPPQKRRV